MSDIIGAAKAVIQFVVTDAPPTLSIPDSVADDEAVHAVLWSA